MQRGVLFVPLILMSLCSTGLEAWGLQWTSDGVVFDVQYEEPTQKADGTPLTDLSHTHVYYQIEGHAPVKGADVPATRPEGGGTINTTLKVPILPGQSAGVSIWATATNKTGERSARSNAVFRPIFRTEVQLK